MPQCQREMYIRTFKDVKVIFVLCSWNILMFVDYFSWLVTTSIDRSCDLHERKVIQAAEYSTPAIQLVFIWCLVPLK